MFFHVDYTPHTQEENELLQLLKVLKTMKQSVTIKCFQVLW